MVNVVGRDKKHVHQATCFNCASILEYTLSETKTENWDAKGGGGFGKQVITCPECASEVAIKRW